MHSHLYNCLDSYAKRSFLRLHMPGHGGVLSPFDVTETDLTDNLLSPRIDGAIAADEREAAELFGAKCTLFSAGGATLCLQTAIAYQVSRMPQGASVFCVRGVHQSVLHALALLDVDPVFLEGEESVYKAEVGRGDVFLFCGCDYFGNVPDYAALSEFCRERGLSTVVDNAHGTHLRFLAGGRNHPLTYGFDLVVDSPHKTLSCLTGAALLHAGEGIDLPAAELSSDLRRFMRLFSSSSPSFLILLSLTEALSEIRAGFDGQNYAPFLRRAACVRRASEASGRCNLSCDPLRFVPEGVSDGTEPGAFLQKEGVSPELANESGLVLLFGENVTEEDALCVGKLLKSALHSMPSAAKKQSPPVPPERVLSLREALLAPSEWVEKNAAVHRISAEIVGHYPPATALCMPGERLTSAVLESLDAPCVRVVKERE